jgi:uncharacterized membrane protein YfcA
VTLLVAFVVAMLVFMLAAAAQAVTGFGLALVAVPFLTVAMGPVAAVVSTTVVSLALTAWASLRERAHVERRVAGRLVVSALLGMPAGLLLLAELDERPLKAVIAGVLLLMVALLVAKVRLPGGVVAQWGAGLLSGAMLTSTGMNGPPLVLTMQALGLAPRRFRGTLQTVFCVQDLVAVGGFVLLGYVTPLIGVAALAGVAGLPLGWWVGDRFFARLSPGSFRAAVLSMLALTALVGLVTALV